MVDEEGKIHDREGFTSCILSSSAIGNIRILAETFGHELETRITDHFSIGALLHLPPGNLMDEFKHQRLWSGYIPVPNLATNIFLHEMEPLPNGDRMMDICAVTEQGSTWSDYSKLTTIPDSHLGLSTTYVDSNITQKDKNRLFQVKKHLLMVINKIAGGIPDDLTKEDDLSYFRVLDEIQNSRTGTMSWYSFPYGSFEHESCTHPLGNKGPVTVTDELEIKELPKVYLAGPGNFPRLGAANPSLTILSMSHSLADILSAS